ncbi:unnamed protein product, partial [Brassica napus]
HLVSNVPSGCAVLNETLNHYIKSSFLVLRFLFVSTSIHCCTFYMFNQ